MGRVNVGGSRSVRLTAGTVIQKESTITNVTGTTYARRTYFTVLIPGVYRVVWTLRSSGGTAYGKICKNNGTLVGTERNTASTSNQTYTEDLTFAAGDTIEVWLKGGGASYAAINSSMKIQNAETLFTLVQGAYGPSGLTLTKDSGSYSYNATKHYIAYALDGVESYTNITDLTSDIILSGHTSVKYKAYAGGMVGRESRVGTTAYGSELVIASCPAEEPWEQTVYSSWINITGDVTHYCYAGQ